MKKVIFAFLMLALSGTLFASEAIKIDMSGVWSKQRAAGRVICASGTGTAAVPCVVAARDYAFTAQNCGFVFYLGQRIANCIVQDDFGTRTWVFATNNGSGWRAVGVIKDGIFDTDIQTAGSVANYAASLLPTMNNVFRNMFVPTCPVPGAHFGFLVERLQFSLASNVLTVNQDTGELSLAAPPWPHASCPQ